jgi:hypothetical protein
MFAATCRTGGGDRAMKNQQKGSCVAWLVLLCALGRTAFMICDGRHRPHVMAMPAVIENPSIRATLRLHVDQRGERRRSWRVGGVEHPLNRQVWPSADASGTSLVV